MSNNNANMTEFSNNKHRTIENYFKPEFDGKLTGDTYMRMENENNSIKTALNSTINTEFSNLNSAYINKKGIENMETNQTNNVKGVFISKKATITDMDFHEKTGMDENSDEMDYLSIKMELELDDGTKLSKHFNLNTKSSCQYFKAQMRAIGEELPKNELPDFEQLCQNLLDQKVVLNVEQGVPRNVHFKRLQNTPISNSVKIPLKRIWISAFPTEEE